MTIVTPTVAADGVTDDRAAIQAAINSLPDTGGTVYLPGLCYVGSAGTSGGAPYGIAITRNNVTLTGAAGAGLTSDVPGIRVLVIAGPALSTPTDPLANWITTDTVLPFAGPQTADSSTITLAASSDAATLTPGDTIFLRTGSLTASALNREPDAELNIVTAVSGATVTLKYPTKKPYAQEFFPNAGQTNNGVSATTGAGAACPFGVANLTGRVITGVTVRGLKVWCTDTSGGTGAGIFILQAWGVTLDTCNVKGSKYGIASRFSRAVQIISPTVQMVAADASVTDPAWIAPSTGCSDWIITSGRGSTTGQPAKLHCHEGISDLKYVDWQSTCANGLGQSGASNVSVRARAYGHYYDLTMTGAYTSSASDMVNVSSQVTSARGQVYFERLNLTGTPGRYMVNFGSTTPTIEQGNLSLTGTGAVGSTSYAGSPLVTGGTDPTNVVLAGMVAGISRVGTAVATAGAVTTTTSCTTALPAGIASGDVLIVAVHRTNDYPLTQGTPAGWTFLRNILDVGTSPNAGQTDLYWRAADGTETTTGPTFTTGTTTRWIIHAAAYRGVDPVTPFAAEGGVTQATNVTAHASPTLVNPAPNAWAVFAVLGRGATPVTWTPDPALVEQLDTDLGVANSSNIYAEWSGNGPVASGTYTYTATASSASNIGTHWLGFLQPALPPVFTGYGTATLAFDGISAATLTGSPAVAATLAGNGASTAALADATGVATLHTTD